MCSLKREVDDSDAWLYYKAVHFSMPAEYVHWAVIQCLKNICGKIPDSVYSLTLPGFLQCFSCWIQWALQLPFWNPWQLYQILHCPYLLEDISYNIEQDKIYCNIAEHAHEANRDLVYQDSLAFGVCKDIHGSSQMGNGAGGGDTEAPSLRMPSIAHSPQPVLQVQL